MSRARRFGLLSAVLPLLAGLLAQAPRQAPGQQSQPVQPLTVTVSLTPGSGGAALDVTDAEAQKKKAAADAAAAEAAAAAAAHEAGSDMSLPFTFRDDQGTEWQIRQDGTTGRADLFPNDGYGKLSTNLGTYPDNTQARWNSATNRMVIGPSVIHGVKITRFLDFDKKNGYCRYVDLYENGSDKDVRFDLTWLYFKVATGWHTRKNVGENPDTGQVSSLMLGSKTVFTGLIFAGHGSTNLPKVEWDELGVNIEFPMVVPAHGVCALLHVQVCRNSADEVVAFLRQANDADLLKDLPPKAAGHIFNFDVAPQYVAGALVTHIGKYELARGDKLDVIELRNGDHYKGTITNASYRIQTAYGTFELPAANVAGIVSLSPSGTRQLLVTIDRQALAGRLDKPTLRVELPAQSGSAAPQVVEVPLTDIAQVGYRPRAHEGEVRPNRPQVLLLGGDVLAIDAPQGNASMVTRYGAIAVPFDRIAVILFDSETVGLHDVRLTDGSHFGALLESSQMPLHLRLPLAAGDAKPDAKTSEVRFAPGSISRLTLGASTEKLDDQSVLKVANDDLLVGTIQGKLAFDTALETMNVDPERISRLARVGEGNETSYRLTFTDDSAFSGQIHGTVVPFVLAGGAVLQIPVDQLHEFTRPRPAATPATGPASAPATKPVH